MMANTQMFTPYLATVWSARITRNSEYRPEIAYQAHSTHFRLLAAGLMGYTTAPEVGSLA